MAPGVGRFPRGCVGDGAGADHHDIVAGCPHGGDLVAQLGDVAPGDGAVVVSFEIPEGLREHFRFEPGQYLTLRRGHGAGDVRRSYSICAAPGDIPVATARAGTVDPLCGTIETTPGASDLQVMGATTSSQGR